MIKIFQQSDKLSVLTLIWESLVPYREDEECMEYLYLYS